MEEKLMDLILYKVNFLIFNAYIFLCNTSDGQSERKY